MLDLTYRILSIDGRECAVWSDGTILPMIRGGADGDGGDGGQGAGDAGTGGEAKSGTGAAGGDAGSAAGGAKDDGKVAFTAEQQAHIDKLINDAMGKGAAKGAKEREDAIKAYLEEQGLGEAEQARAERDRAAQERDEAKREALAARVEAKAETAAVAAGVKADRVARFLKLVDLSDLDKLTADGKPDEAEIRKLIDAELATVPEFKGTSSNGASGAEFNGANGAQPAKTLEEAVGRHYAST